MQRMYFRGPVDRLRGFRDAFAGKPWPTSWRLSERLQPVRRVGACFLCSVAAIAGMSLILFLWSAVRTWVQS